MRRSAPAAPTLTTPVEALAPAYVPNVVPPIVVLLTVPVLPVAVVAVPDVTAPEPSATEPATLALEPEPNASAFVALEFALSPSAMPYALFTVAARPTAMPEVAVATTDDCPPTAMPSVAAELAAAVVLPPIATDPVFVAFAPLNVPATLPPPTATALVPDAVAKLP
ncbi:hypothetical protein WL17_30655 [Burkholderia ubonensis]|nr:hypothetical protein WL17_30655 [Burkholderia ubonensis]